MQRSRLRLSIAFLLRNRSFLSAHSGDGGKLDKRRVFAVGTTLRKRPGLVVRRAGSYVLSTAKGVLFFFSCQRCFHSCVVQVHGMELCRHMTD